MRTVLFTSLLLALAGCGRGTATLSTRVGARSAAAPLLVAGNVDVQRVRIAIRDIRLRSGTASTESSSGADDASGDVDFRTAPTLLDLSGTALEGGVVQQFAVTAPAGTYSRLRFEVHPFEGALPDNAAAQDLFTAGASVLVDGTVNGNAFSYASSLTEQQELSGAFTISGDGTDNVTLNIDPAGWFVDGNGTALDPSVQANHSQIENNIAASIDAFDDDDHSGHDDATETEGEHTDGGHR